MSTRATYYFEKAKINIYIHHDGYLKGASTYFNKMLLATNGHIDVNAFIRENKGAEITGINCHCDLEYIYKIDEEKQSLKVYTAYHGTYARAENIIYNGCLYDFVNKYLVIFKDDLTKYQNIFYCYESEEIQEKILLNAFKWTGKKSDITGKKIMTNNFVKLKKMRDIFNVLEDFTIRGHHEHFERHTKELLNII